MIPHSNYINLFKTHEQPDIWQARIWKVWKTLTSILNIYKRTTCFGLVFLINKSHEDGVTKKKQLYFVIPGLGEDFGRTWDLFVMDVAALLIVFWWCTFFGTDPLYYCEFGEDFKFKKLNHGEMDDTNDSNTNFETAQI